MQKVILVLTVLLSGFLCFAQNDDIPEEKKKQVEMEIKRINEKIKQKGLKWKAGITSLSYLSDEEFAKLCGDIVLPGPGKPNLRDHDSLFQKLYKKKNNPAKIQSISIPDWKSFMSPIEDQFSCRNCWAHAATGVVEGLLNKKYGDINKKIDLDEMYITENNSGCGSCDGGTPNCAFEFIRDEKVMTETGINNFPNFDSTYYSLYNYNQLPNADSCIKSALHNSPVYVTMKVYKDFKHFTGNGIYSPTGDPLNETHGIVIVDSNKTEGYWLCKNSWGVGWGESGYCKIAYGTCRIGEIRAFYAQVNDNCYPIMKVPKHFSTIESAVNTIKNIYTIEVNSDSYNVNSNIILHKNVTLDIADSSVVTFNGTVDIQDGSDLKIGSNSTITFKDNVIKNEDIDFGDNSIIIFDAASPITFDGFLSLPDSNGKLIINGNVIIDGNLLVKSGSEIEIGSGSSLQINGSLSGNYSISIIGSSNSSLTINSTYSASSGKNITFSPELQVSFNQNVILYNGSNLFFGKNTFVDFNGMLNLYAGSSCTFGDSSDVDFFDVVNLNGSFVFGPYATVRYYEEAFFNRGSSCTYDIHTIIYYMMDSSHDGDSEFCSSSTVSFEDSVYFGGGANSTFRSDVTVTYLKPCLIDSGAVVNYTHDVTALHKSDFKVYGQFWADNSILDFGDDSTTAAGVVFEGEGASLSRITDSIIKDGVDGFTITNSSPLIKTSEIRNILKRGFNIKGIDAEPEIRDCFVHLCSTYPVQVLYEANPKIVDSRLYGGSKTAARIWGADGEYSRNEFRSNGGSGAFTFSSSANPQFFSYADSGGNMFDMANIGAHGVFIGGGYPLFGDSPNILGNNTIKNRGSHYYIYNDTPGTILAELNWWPDGTGSSTFYNADGGSIDTSPKLDEEPPSGPLSKTAVSPYATGFEKFRKKDYENAMTELKEALKQDKKSYRADKAVFQLAKSARKIGRLGELEPLLNELQKETDPQIQYHSRNWLCYLYASRNKMHKAEKLASKVPAGSSLERTLLLDICSYYAAWKDTVNATRIADILKSRHNNDVLEMELEAAMEGYVDFQQVRGKTKIKRPVINPAMEPEVTVADTVQFKTGVFPNPFNASTTVHFNLKDEGHVSIVVYDLLGRKVKTLVDENRSTGAHRVVWDGRDESGMTASSGIYFVRIRTRDAARTFKISYLK